MDNFEQIYERASEFSKMLLDTHRDICLLIDKLQKMSDIKRSRELSLTITKAQETRLWLEEVSGYSEAK